MTIKNVINCLLCGSSSELKHKAYPGYQIPSVFEIYYCPACNTSFSMPRDESKGIYELIYKNGSKVRWYERYWNYAKAVKNENKPLNFLAESEDIYWAVKESIRLITLDSSISPKILEIGCGLGYLTYSLNKEGYNSLGLDISKEAVNRAIQNYGNYYICADLYEYAINHENEYDIIIFTEVIEHLNDINSFMEKLKKLLTSEGKIILTTPNKSFYPLEVLWATDLPPVHCWWLSEKSVKYIANKLNMNVSFLDFQNYYSRHLTWIDLRNILIPITPPVFDKDEFLIYNTNSDSKIWIVIKKNLTKVKMIKLLYNKLRYLIIRNNRNILFPQNRGPVLCALLQLK